jgi:ribulose-phosphate 3-epimerase
MQLPGGIAFLGYNQSMAPQPMISASILSADFTRLGDQIAEAEQAGADWIHIDVIDGHFAPPITMGQVVVEACRKATTLPLDVHLMVDNPDAMLRSFADAGADHIHIHIEASPDIEKSLKTIRKLGCKAGLAINPDTPAATLLPYLKDADITLIMSVHPGYSGQDFIPQVLPKSAEIHRVIDASELDTLIEFDGGIDPETLPLAMEAGGHVFVAASAVYKHPKGVAAGIQALRSASTANVRNQ